MSDETFSPSSELEAKRARARQLLEQRNRERSWPLSSAQERLWFLDRAEPGSTQYNVPCAVELRGRLDRAALEQSLAALVERHPILRSRVRDIVGVPRLMLAESPGALQIVELDEAVAEAELRGRLEQLAARPFDLAAGPLGRFTLLTCGATRAVLLVEVHHIAFDAVSLGLFIDELGALYRRAVGGGPELAPLPLSYGDYAAWQKAWLAGEERARQLAYWTEALAGAPPVFEISLDRPRQPMRHGGAAVHRCRVPASLVRGVDELARQHKATRFMVLLAAWSAALHRHSGVEDLVLGTTVTGRPRPELERLIGLFVNTLPLRVDLSGDPSFLELIERARACALGAFANQDLPFDHITTALRLPRERGRSPLVQQIFELHDGGAAVRAASLGEVEIAPLAVDATAAKFDLVATFGPDDDGGLLGELEYATELYDGASVAALGERFLRLLAGALSAPRTKVSALPLVSAAEQAALVAAAAGPQVAWHDVVPGLTPEMTFPELYASVAARFPEAPAVIDHGVRWSYRELARRSAAVAAGLRALGVGPGAVVPLLADRSPAFLAGMLGAMEVGAAFAPLDPKLPEARLAASVAQLGPATVLAGAAYGALAARLGALRTAGLDELVAAADDDAHGDRDAAAPAAPAGRPDDVAYVIFTSGSTGTPKGVLVEQRGMINHLIAKVRGLGVTSSDVVAQNATQSFDVCVWQFLCALLAGGCTAVFADESAWEPGPMLGRMARDGVTILETVPTHMRMVLHELEERGQGAAPLGPLRWFVVNGEPLLPELCARWFRVAPAVPLINAYGPTECSDDVCHFELRGPLERPWTYVPIDGTLPNLRVHVVDRHFAPVPAGAPGELCVGGVGVGRGYLGDAARTAAAFVPDPFTTEPSARLYRTGDVVRRWADGTIEFLGRIDHQVKIRGFRIEIGEIESALSAHPEVRECVVVARADRAAEKRLCAYLVAADPARPPSGKALADHVRDVLAPYMVPQAFVVLPALPLLPNGKIDRGALPAPSASDLATSSSYVAPRGETEAEVARLWAELLVVEQVGAEDNFFELGGHSILALQFLSRIKRSLGVELGVRAIFEAQTVAELARRIDAQRAAPAEAAASPYARLPLTPAPALEEYELAAYQLPEWFMRELAPDSAFYNVDLSGLVFTGALDAAAFLAAWQALIDRHAIFRTTFPRRDGKPMQRVAPSLRLDAAEVLIDRSDVPEERVADEMKAMASTWARKLFDLEAGPIFRVHLASFSGDRHLFGFAIHHIAWDETSTLTMARELAELYNAARAGRPAALPPAPLAYVDFAHWVNQALQTGVLESERQYWLEAFRTPPPALDLPTDFPRPVTPRFEGATVSATIDRALVSRLDARVREHRTTLYVYLLAVVNTLLYRLTGQDDIVVGTPIANRDDERLEGTLGLFATALPIRSRFRDGMSFRQLLEQARATTIEAVDHHHYPSVLAIQEISRGWDSSRSRLFSVMYGTQNDKSRFLDELRFDGAELGFIADADSPEFDTARFDLTFIVDRIGADTFLHVNYDTALFTGETAQRFLRQALSLVEQTLDEPDRALAALRLLDAQEERALLEASRGPRTDWDARPVPARFREQVARHPARVAVEDDQVRWSYRELAARVSELAAQLRDAGVVAGTPVAVTLAPSAELVAALLAVLETGAGYLPLVPELPLERRQEILARAGAALVIEEVGAGEGRESGESGEAGAPRAPRATVRATGVAAAAPLAELAYVIFTSGTTGVPKGIAIGHPGLAHLLAATQRAYQLGEGDAVLFSTSASFDASILDVFWPLVAGARVVVAASGEARDPARLAARAQERGATVLQLVPAQLEALCLSHEAGELPALATSPLRLVIVGGAALPSALARRAQAALPAARLVNHYGPTEVTVDALTFDCRGEMVEAVAPIGRPLDDTAAYVVDRWGNLVPPGVKGEVLVASPGLALGYLGDARATEERFVTFAATGERVYRTGDVARWAGDGQLRFVGRLDKQVKVRGNRVELEEVEAHLASHPLVDRVWCAVDEQEAASRLLAWVQPARRSIEVEVGGSVLYAFTLAQRPELRAAVERLHMELWPEWFLGDEVMRRLWPRLLGERADWQFLFVDERDQLCGAAHAAAIAWDGTVADLPRGWDDALERTFASDGREPDTLVGFAGVIDERVAGRGLSAALIHGFKTLAARRGLARVALPIRPTGKSEHPEVSFAEWCARRRPDGSAEDAWIRMHERAGGKILGIEEQSQRVVASIEEWERWTGRSLRGETCVHAPGSLGPVQLDPAAGVGVYVEPCLWFDHASEASLPWQPLDPEALRQALRAKVPEYMVPDALRFALRLPANPSGKLDEQALRELLRQASARPARQVSAPRTALQGELVALWAGVLGVAAGEVGVDDDFFNLGGHSLAAVRMLAKVKKQLAAAVSLRDFFRARTVARLEELVQKAREVAP